MIDWDLVLTVEHKNKVAEDEARKKRDLILSETDWIVIRHRDEIESCTQTTISVDKYNDLLLYRKLLRDLPSNEGWYNKEIPLFSVDE